MKKSVGVLFIVGGLSIVGYYLLTLTKPKDRESQLVELDQKAKDLANSKIDIDNSDITKAKELSEKIIFWRDSVGTDEETKKNKALIPVWYAQLTKLNYFINGTELKRN